MKFFIIIYIEKKDFFVTFASNQHRSVTMVTKLQVGKQRNWNSICGRGKASFSITTIYRSALGPTLSPTQCVPGPISPGIKQLAHEADHSPPTSAEVKNSWSHTSIPPQVFTALSTEQLYFLPS
jgi:hypothetical protein